jgi:hypothetical protein
MNGKMLIEPAKSHIETRLKVDFPFETRIFEDIAIFLLRDQPEDLPSQFQPLASLGINGKFSEKHFEKSLVNPELLYPVHKRQQVVYIYPPRLEKPLDFFSLDNPPDEAMWEHLTKTKLEKYERTKKLVLNRHPGRKAASKNLFHTAYDPIKLKFDVVYGLDLKSEVAPLIGEIKLGPVTEDSKINRRLSQLTSYAYYLDSLNNGHQIALIYPTLPSFKELTAYSEFGKTHSYAPNIIVVSPKDYIGPDLTQRIQRWEKYLEKQPNLRETSVKAVQNELGYLNDALKTLRIA